MLGLRLSRAFLKLLEPVASLRFIDQPEFGRLTQALCGLDRKCGLEAFRSRFAEFGVASGLIPLV